MTNSKLDAEKRAVLVSPKGVEIIQVEAHSNPMRHEDEEGSHTFTLWAGPLAVGSDRVVETTLYRRSDMGAEQASTVLGEWRAKNKGQGLLWP